MKKLIILFLSLNTIFLLWCDKNATIKEWDMVSIVYTWTFENGKLFETWKRTIKVWSWEFIEWIEKYIINKSFNKNYKIKITPEKWYGFLYSTWNQQRISVFIFEKLWISTKIWTTATLDKTIWTITKHEKDQDWNTIIIFDVNPPETRQNILYEIYVENFKIN